MSDWKSRAQPVGDWRSRAQPVADEGSPLDRALAEQTGDIVTVETPTGPAQFNRSGQRILSSEEARQGMDAAAQGGKIRALEGALSFASGGGPLLDEMRGLGEALDPSRLGETARRALAGEQVEGPIDTYRRVRDSTRNEVNRATRNASPVVNVAGVSIPVLPALGAAAPSLLAPNPAGVLGRIASAGVQGAESALGTSTADLTRGEGGQLAKDVALGGGIGLASGGVAEAMGAPLRALSRATGAEASAAKDAVTAATQAAKDKAAASALGGVGRITATQGNSMETVMEVLRNPQWFSDDVVQEAYAIAQSPEGKLMLSRAASNNLSKLRQSFAAETPAREALATAQAAAAPQAVASEVAQKTALPAIAEDVGGKFMRSVGQRAALGAAGSALGAGTAWLTGGDPRTGAGIGATAGFMPQGVLQFARNQAKSPAVQYGANTVMSGLLNRGAGLLSKEASVLTPIAEQSRPSLDEREQDAITAFVEGGI